MWIEIAKLPSCFYILRGIPHSYLSRLVDLKFSSETSFSSESGSKICSESKNIRFCLARIQILPNIHLFHSYFWSRIKTFWGLQMSWNFEVWHKIHVRIDWWKKNHPGPPWARNGGSKICLELKKHTKFPNIRGCGLRFPSRLFASTCYVGYRIHIWVGWWT